MRTGTSGPTQKHELGEATVTTARARLKEVDRAVGSSRGGQLTARNVAILIGVLILAKVIVSGAVYELTGGQATLVVDTIPESAQGLHAMLLGMSTNWDGALYQHIASFGYGGSDYVKLYAFSPAFPILILIAKAITGSYWTATLVTSNLLGFVFPMVVLKVFDLRTALLAELFSTYVVYTLVGYSDALALIFLALAFLFFVRARRLLAGVSLALAGLVMYDLLVAVAAFVAFMLLVEKKHFVAAAREYVLLVLPIVATAVGILIAYWVATRNPLDFLALEHAHWSVAPATPAGQVQYILSGSGQESFFGGSWSVLGYTLTPTYWLVRNVLFEAFFFAGIFLLTRTTSPYKWLFVTYSCLLTIPFLFVEGIPVYSIPRLFLAAFPVFYGYSEWFKTRPWPLVGYAAASIVGACWALISFLIAFFA